MPVIESRLHAHQMHPSNFFAHRFMFLERKKRASKSISATQLGHWITNTSKNNKSKNIEFCGEQHMSTVVIVDGILTVQSINPSACARGETFCSSN